METILPIRIQEIGSTQDGATKKLARLRGTKLFYEENHHTIWITWLETPPKEQNRGQAKTLIEFLKKSKKPIRPGTFTKAAAGLKKCFEPNT